MTISLEIIPLSDSIEILGEPDPLGAYSLSGHIMIKLKPSTNIFCMPPHPEHVTLRSLTLTFEGQSELVDSDGSYSAIRLCSYTKELIDTDTEIYNEDFEESTWRAVFNLVIPGWLPPTCQFGDSGYEPAGIRYGLYASATFVDINELSEPSFISNIFYMLSPSTRIIDSTRHDIVVTRRFTPSSNTTDTSDLSQSVFPSTTYAISERIVGSQGTDSLIPKRVLDKLKVQVSVPQQIDVDKSALPFILRLRSHNLDSSECAQIKISEIVVDVEQTEFYRFAPAPSVLARYPIPPPNRQPPEEPLRESHTLHSFYDVGIVSSRKRRSQRRSFSLMSGGIPGSYRLPGDGYIFKHDSHSSYTIDATAQLATELSPSTKDWAGACLLRSTMSSPHFSVKHQMHVSLLCTYDDPDRTENVRANIRFSIPLKFVNFKSDTPYSLAANQPASLWHSAYPQNVPYMNANFAQSLPAYSQLFYSNGERKVDHSIPLPLYTPYNVGDPPADDPSPSISPKLGEMCPLLLDQDDA